MERVMVNGTAISAQNDVMSQSMALEDAPRNIRRTGCFGGGGHTTAGLDAFVEELPAGIVVFNLYTFEDKSHKEIAQLLGINESPRLQIVSCQNRAGGK